MIEYPVKVRADELEFKLEEHSSGFLPVSYVRGMPEHILYECTITYHSLFQLQVPSLASKNQPTEGVLKRKANNHLIGKPFKRKSSMFTS